MKEKKRKKKKIRDKKKRIHAFRSRTAKIAITSSFDIFSSSPFSLSPLFRFLRLGARRPGALRRKPSFILSLSLFLSLHNTRGCYRGSGLESTSYPGIVDSQRRSSTYTRSVWSVGRLWVARTRMTIDRFEIASPSPVLGEDCLPSQPLYRTCLFLFPERIGLPFASSDR